MLLPGNGLLLHRISAGLRTTRGSRERPEIKFNWFHNGCE